jgi:hypothetical protein
VGLKWLLLSWSRHASSADVLSKLKGAKDAERCLFAAIFDPKHSPGEHPCLGTL